MTFFKNTLIMLTILAVAIWVMPVTSDETEVTPSIPIFQCRDKIKQILKKLYEVYGDDDDISSYIKFMIWLSPKKELTNSISHMFIDIKTIMPISRHVNGVLVTIGPTEYNTAGDTTKLAFKLIKHQMESGSNVETYCSSLNTSKIIDLFFSTDLNNITITP